MSSSWPNSVTQLHLPLRLTSSQTMVVKYETWTILYISWRVTLETLFRTRGLSAHLQAPLASLIERAPSQANQLREEGALARLLLASGISSDSMKVDVCDVTNGTLCAGAL